ncbi:hypothetical protein PRK78_001572 [Emydomyces testavorans]|uniref:Aminoglycoside phosphotransferase domain-containing protein n=1 Tax=Emydomyces testavorans TaxID=2070801 RepID=A0AAF0DER0_9EURO|nr:hypothetical protein PRK78_001572 [Emydomyces testavorans]
MTPAQHTFRWNGQHDDQRSMQTYCYADWEALLREVQVLNCGRSCVYDGRYHAGGHHIVRRLKFDDSDELWLVRIPIMPGLLTLDQNDTWWTAERRFTMESEIATMKYIAKYTAIPVPTIFGYRTSIDENPVRLPYMLMQCIRGNMLYDLGGPEILNEEQKCRIRESIASIQCQMATASISKLGSLILKPNGKIDIGPLPSSFGFEGPFTSEVDYFVSWATHAKFGNPDFLHTKSEDNSLQKLKQDVMLFPAGLRSVVEKRLLSNSSSSEHRYPIVHRDFELHNILFDDSFNIVGVIDWEFAHSAPMEVFAVLTNMYSRFDSTRLHVVTDSEYIKEVRSKDLAVRQGCKLAGTFGSIWGDVGMCMVHFEEGIALPFGQLLNRVKGIDG